MLACLSAASRTQDWDAHLVLVDKWTDYVRPQNMQTAPSKHSSQRPTVVLIDAIVADMTRMLVIRGLWQEPGDVRGGAGANDVEELLLSSSIQHSSKGRHDLFKPS